MYSLKIIMNYFDLFLEYNLIIRIRCNIKRKKNSLQLKIISSLVHLSLKFSCMLKLSCESGSALAVRFLGGKENRDN